MAFMNTPRTEEFNVIASFKNFFTKLAEARARRALYLQTLHQLRALSDHELTDINISRVQITDIARRAAYEN